jgi:hypothetical protein
MIEDQRNDNRLSLDRPSVSNSMSVRPTGAKRKRPKSSYRVQLEDGTTRRRNARHVRFSAELKITVYDGDGVETTLTRKTNPRPKTSGIDAIDASRVTSLDSANSPKQSTLAQKPVVITRSGRIVRRPARYND